MNYNKSINFNIKFSKIKDLIPSDVIKIWNQIYLYESTNYFENLNYKNKDKFINRLKINFYNDSLKKINILMNDYYKNIRNINDKIYLNKITNNDINDIKIFHKYMILKIKKKLIENNNENKITSILKKKNKINKINSNKIKTYNKNNLFFFILIFLIIFINLK